MAKPASPAGGIVGLALAVLIVGGLVGSPLYLGLLQSDEQALSAAVRDDVETVRRVVLTIDENLAAVADLRSGAADMEAVNRALEEKPDLLSAAQAEQEALTRQFRAVETADAERGVAFADAGPSPRIDARQAVSDMEQKYLRENDRLLAESRKSIAAMKSAGRGEASGTQNLDVNHVEALVNFAEGRLAMNRAAAERRRADHARLLAQARKKHATELRRAAEHCAIKDPSERLTAIAEQLAGINGRITAVDQAIGALKTAIAGKEQAMSQLAAKANEARSRLASLGSPVAGAPRDAFEAYQSEVIALSAELRAAEAEASALEMGTLRGAVLPPDADDDLLAAAYEGGAPEMGLRDLKIGLEQLESAAEALRGFQTDLSNQSQSLTDAKRALAMDRDKLSAGADAETAAAKEALDEAAAAGRAELESIDAAAKAFAEAGRAARSAIQAAKSRKTAARTEASASPSAGQDARLQMIVQDEETEAGLLVFAAEIEYHTALADAVKIDALRTQHAAEASLAATAGLADPQPVDEAVQAARADAVLRLGNAIQTYDQAIQKIESSNVKVGESRVSGKSYVWQAQLGKASVHWLHAQLAEGADEAAAQRDFAYKLLTEAAEGREQSPLLSTALDAIQFMQKTVN